MPQHPAAVKPSSRLPSVHSFAPDDSPPPSLRATAREVSVALREAGPNRVRWRVRILWSTPNASGQREELHEFGDVRKAFDLLCSVNETPHRALVSSSIEAKPIPRWEPVSVDFLKARVAQRERRDEIKRVMAKRAAERKAGAR